MSANVSQFMVNPYVLADLMRTHSVANIAELSKKSRVKRGVLTKIDAGKSVDVSSAQAIADCFGVPLSRIGEPLAVPLTSPQLYHAFGLLDKLRPITLQMNEFQNFELGDDHRRPDDLASINNPIDFLWADAIGQSSIKASAVCDAENGHAHLHIEFDTPTSTVYGTPYPGNVAIHPQWLTAVEINLSDFPIIAMPCRAIEGTLPMPNVAPIQISLRVRDRKLRQWVYGTMDTNHVRSLSQLFPLDNGWKLLQADLRAEKWTAFGSDAVSTYARPDFEVITSITVEVGRAASGRRPGPGKGAVDIGPITFEKSIREFVPEQKRA